MNILILIGSVAGGGAERQVQYLAALLPQNGDSVTVAVLGKGVHPKELAGAPIVPLRGAGGWPGAILRLRRLARRFDVVYSWMDVANACSGIALSFTRVPQVWGLRSSNLVEGAVARAGFLLSKWLSGRARYAISNSDPVQQFYQDNGFSPRAWHTVPNGVDTSLFCPAEAAGGESAPLAVGMVARADPLKRHDIFLAMVAELAPRFPRINWVLAGLGTDDPGGLVERDIERFNLRDQIDVRGVVDDVPKLYRSLDVLVCCSDFEGSSNAVLEAMSCGVPVISFSVGDAEDLLADGGIITPANSIQALVDTVPRLLEDSARRRAMGQAGRQRALARHSIEQLATDTRAILTRAANQS